MTPQNRRLTRCQLWSEAADELARHANTNRFAVFALRWIAFAVLFEPLTDKEISISSKDRERMLADFIRRVCGNTAAANIIADALKKNKNEILNLVEDGQEDKLSKKISDRKAEQAAIQILKRIRAFRNRVFHGKITPTEHADRQTASDAARILKELTLAFADALKA